MGIRCIPQNTDNFFLGQNIAVIQRQKQRLANRQCGSSGNVIGRRHIGFHFQSMRINYR